MWHVFAFAFRSLSCLRLSWNGIVLSLVLKNWSWKTSAADNVVSRSFADCNHFFVWSDLYNSSNVACHSWWHNRWCYVAIQRAASCGSRIKLSHLGMERQNYRFLRFCLLFGAVLKDILTMALVPEVTGFTFSDTDDSAPAQNFWIRTWKFPEPDSCSKFRKPSLQPQFGSVCNWPMTFVKNMQTAEKKKRLRVRKKRRAGVDSGSVASSSGWPCKETSMSSSLEFTKYMLSFVHEETCTNKATF